NAGLADPQFKARLVDLGGTPAPMSAAEFGSFIAEETGKWAKVIKFANVKPEGWAGVVAARYSMFSASRFGSANVVHGSARQRPTRRSKTIFGRRPCASSLQSKFL